MQFKDLLQFTENFTFCFDRTGPELIELALHCFHFDTFNFELVELALTSLVCCFKF